ncbi:MAG: DUF5723 family protein, partial [Syntrophothermus sp.]
GTEDRMFYTYGSSTRKDAFVNNRINGPGAIILRGKHAFGIFTDLRSVFSVTNLPVDIANFAYLGLNYRPQQKINYKENRPFTSAEMTWGEIGLSYAYRLYERNYDRIDIGISVKRLFGYTGSYGYVTNMDYMIPDDSTIIVNNINAEVGYSLPVDYGNEIGMYNGKTIKGHGWGFDVGFTYTRLKRLAQTNYFTTFCSQPYAAYDYRVSLALVDFGSINFKDHAEKIRIEDKSSYWENVRNYDFRGVQQLVDTVSYQFYGNDSAAYVADNFRLWLPTALSLQVDYHVQKNWFVNGSFLLGVPFSHASLRRPAVVAITPRYETHWFEANLPISLYDWYLPRMGLSLRFWWVTIGTEKLGEFFNFRNFTGMDAYFSIKFFFDKGNCRSARQKGCADREYKVK